MSNSFKSGMKEELPRERLLKYGVENLSNVDLISIILKTGTKNLSVREVATNLINELNDISELKYLTINNLVKKKGIGLVKALELISALELGKRVYYQNNNKIIKIKNSNDVFKIMKDKFINTNKEYFYVIYLNSKSNIIDIKLLFIGNVNSCIIDVSEIFKNAYLLSATSFICVHNHPTGDVKPSKNDDINTIKIIKIGKLQNILLRDHLIIGKDKYYSYYENNNLVF